jgi:hypothetical protein
MAGEVSMHERDERFAHNIELIRLAQSGDKAAMERLVMDNMGFAPSKSLGGYLITIPQKLEVDIFMLQNNQSRCAGFVVSYRKW